MDCPLLLELAGSANSKERLIFAGLRDGWREDHNIVTVVLQIKSDPSQAVCQDKHYAFFFH
jgi:hypothetical protein